jgi:hypothetical protein
MGGGRIIGVSSERYSQKYERRLFTNPAPDRRARAMSDWLTKMLVGVDLVAPQAGATMSEAAAVLARVRRCALDACSTGEAQVFATDLVAYFFVAGLTQGFLLTRMRRVRRTIGLAWMLLRTHLPVELRNGAQLVLGCFYAVR